MPPHSWHSATWSYAPYQAQSTGSGPSTSSSSSRICDRGFQVDAGGSCGSTLSRTQGCTASGSNSLLTAQYSCPSSVTTPIDTSVISRSVSPNSRS